MSSIQLFSIREAISESGWSPALARVKEVGFTQVEPFAIHLLAEDLVPAIRESGLATPTAHGFLDADALDATLDVAERLGITTVFHPHIDDAGWQDADAVSSTASMLIAAAERAADRGIRVGFHNHEAELVHRVGGESAFWALLGQLPETVLVEYDIYWAAIAGVDIVAEIERLGARAAALHIKDGPYGATAQDQVALGDGDLPLGEILTAAAHALPVLSLDRFVGSADEVWTAVERSRSWLEAEVPA
jgi:sugar phosphate isomerase/epimerase